ncbi:NAD(P)-binding protein [Schizopora paradoxa]|uniref:NAD(P)-binding protein n=1 Tax=Schizopora paradoxa TaxID=27342 RepID=A0A0H2RRG0_9AGAM|nr:NAD(P)-binding protein [Schizopora paradoxa]
MDLPTKVKALVLRKGDANAKPVFHDAVLDSVPLRKPSADEIVVKVSAVAFNHRDLWIRRGLYPGIQFDTILGSDAVGTVVASGKGQEDELLNKRCFLVPMRGWESDPYGPETRFGILGGCNFPSLGTFAEFITVSREQVIIAPSHLSDVNAAAWPLAGVTAWRAVKVNANIQKGDTVLITGIGGGVALVAMQLCLALGARVYVTSGSEEKIKRAMQFGASGGVNYHEDKWGSALGKVLGEKRFDAVIDSAGGDVFGQIGRILKPGGVVVCYGMTSSPSIPFTMREVLKGHKLIGSTMGSHKDLIEATEFLADHKIDPLVSEVLEGLENINKGFEVMEKGSQFGKIVVKFKSVSNTIARPNL